MRKSATACVGYKMDIFAIKRQSPEFSTALVPASQSDADKLKKIKAGWPVRVTVKRVRNYEFHKKFFALMSLAFENWEVPGYARAQFPEQKITYTVEPHKDFDRFRKDVIILAGYYDATYRVDGSVRVEAKSISFANMDEDDFGKLYEATLEAIRKHVFRNMSDTDLQVFLNELEQFE